MIAMTTPAPIANAVTTASRPNSSGSTTIAPVSITHARPIGIRIFQPNAIRRSYRNRGSVARTQM